VLRPGALRCVRDRQRPLRLQHEVRHLDQQPTQVAGAIRLRSGIGFFALSLLAGEEQEGRLAAEEPGPQVEDHVAQHFVTQIGHDAVEGAQHCQLVLVLVILGDDMLHQRVDEVGRFHDLRLGHNRYGLHRAHQVVRMDRERPRQLVDRRKVRFRDGEGFADQAPEQVAAVADGDDQVPDLRAVVTQLGLVTVERRGGAWHHFAAPEVLHDQAEIVLRQPWRDLVAVS
jgi:hypothetical protein